MLKKIDDLAAGVEQILVILLFTTLIGAMGVNIFQRNVLCQSSTDILEYMPTMVLWISLIGASLGLREGKHIVMELLLRFMPQNIKDVLHRIAAIFGCSIMLIGLYLAKDFMVGEITLFGLRGYISSIIPLFFLMASFRYFVLIFYPTHQHD